MGKYYVKFGLSKNFDAGSKAMRDIMVLLEARGYKSVPALPARLNKFFKLADIPVLLLIIFVKVGRKGTLIYFVPSNKQRIRFLKFFRDILNFRLICFINDVESMRMIKSKKYVVGEMESIAAADVVLVPNENSVRILRDEYGLASPLIPVGVWDYLVDDCSFSFHEEGEQKVVAFAGNLKKSPFINDLYSVNLKFKIWGSGKEINRSDGNLDFRGVESPDNLVKYITECSWGLVWDGTSIHTCAGLLGTYLRFNNSHKCGLYLAAGVPIIVWRESGMTFFVEKYKVGICVSSLDEAADVINHMDGDVYEEYRKNAQWIGMQVRQGNFFLSALVVAENIDI